MIPHKLYKILLGAFPQNLTKLIQETTCVSSETLCFGLVLSPSTYTVDGTPQLSDMTELNLIFITELMEEG